MTDIDVKLAIANNTDPFGNKWTMKALEGYGLYTVGTLNDKDEFVVPQSYPKDSKLAGKFTKIDIAQQAITNWCRLSWEWNAQKEQKSARKAHKEKVETEDAGS